MIEYYLLMMASYTLVRTYVDEISHPDVLRRIELANYNPRPNWAATPRGDTPAPSVTSAGSKKYFETNLGTAPEGAEEGDDGFVRESEDLDMESAATSISSVLGDPVQEAEWKDEWRANYETSIKEVGHGLPVRLSLVKEYTSPRPEDKVTEYINRSINNYAGE